jgi:hypothetical protein
MFMVIGLVSPAWDAVKLTLDIGLICFSWSLVAPERLIDNILPPAAAPSPLPPWPREGYSEPSINARREPPLPLPPALQSTTAAAIVKPKGFWFGRGFSSHGGCRSSLASPPSNTEPCVISPTNLSYSLPAEQGTCCLSPLTQET